VLTRETSTTRMWMINFGAMTMRLIITMQLSLALSGLWVKLNRDYSRNNITASDNPSLSQIEFEGLNLMDGWSLSFDVEMPMDGISLCADKC